MKEFSGDKVLLDKYTEITQDLKGSYQKGVSLCFAGKHGTGKQLSLDTELPTPHGFLKLGDLKEGDQVFDEQGNICHVIQLHPINISPESYEVQFDDGTKIKACADHLWVTYTRQDRIKNRQPSIRSTKQIYETLRVEKTSVCNHSIKCSEPLKYPKRKLLIDPYVLGVWLGDGTSREGSIECADSEILDHIKFAGYSVKKIRTSKQSKSAKYVLGDICLSKSNRKIRKLTKELQKLNLINNKHIPDDYLFASSEQRLSLLQGLMDTDGCCLKSGTMEYCTTSPVLAQHVYQLILGLGIKATLRKNSSFLKNQKCKDRFRINFTTQSLVFKLKRKLANIKFDKSQMSRTTHRFIIDVVPIPPVAMRCITVDSISHCYLVTKNCIATHNTMTCTNILKRAVEKGYSSLYVTLNDIVACTINSIPEDRGLARRELLTVDFLVIDEFDPRHMGSDQAADLFGRILEDIFRTRSQNRMPIFLCTNSPKVIDSFTGPIKTSIDSLMNYVTTVTVLGKDYRKEEKNL